ncbi:MAG: Holliday junction resolvase-like protein [Methanosarcinales archaeon Met12]|nr:MAG: Holliday junction resolvase-like protein [Methanosarcinales archaeon Met12]
MNYELLVLLLLILLTICFIFLVRSLMEVKGWEYKFEMRVKEWLEGEERSIREDAIQRSALTRSGKALEKLCPFLADFGYDPHDVRWLGDPVDLIVFDGYAEGHRTGDGLRQIVFVEIKSGKSKLTKAQRKIKALVTDGKVCWDEFKI